MCWHLYILTCACVCVCVCRSFMYILCCCVCACVHKCACMSSYEFAVMLLAGMHSDMGGGVFSRRT